MKQLSQLMACVILACLTSQAIAGDAWKAKPMDWPAWRGPEMNGISREKGLVSSWSPDGENLLWKSKDLATRSTPIVMNGKLYALARWNPASAQEGEKVFCADAATGKLTELERAAKGLAIEWLTDRKLVIAGDRGVSIVDLDGGEPRLLAGATNLVAPRKRPTCAGDVGEEPVLSDDPELAVGVEPTDAKLVEPP